MDIKKKDFFEYSTNVVYYRRVDTSSDMKFKKVLRSAVFIAARKLLIVVRSPCSLSMSIAGGNEDIW